MTIHFLYFIPNHIIFSPLFKRQQINFASFVILSHCDELFATTENLELKLGNFELEHMKGLSDLRIFTGVSILFCQVKVKQAKTVLANENKEASPVWPANKKRQLN